MTEKKNSEKNMDFPFDFNPTACKTCKGKCCRGREGYIWLSKKELEKLAETMNLPTTKFARNYARLVEGRFSLQERLINGEYLCCFFDRITAQCTIYEHRPQQCQTFPFWDEFKQDTQAISDECPGIDFPKQQSSHK